MHASKRGVVGLGSGGVQASDHGQDGRVALGVFHGFGGEGLKQRAVAVDDGDLFLRLSMHASALQVPVAKARRGHRADQQAGREDETQWIPVHFFRC